METIFYTLIVLAFVGNLRRPDLVVKGEVCGRYWIGDTSFGPDSIRNEVARLLSTGDFTIKYGESTIFDVWEMDTALYC